MSLSWLDNEFLSLVLKASSEDTNVKAEDFRIVDFKYKRAVEGDNCISVMFNVHVWYKQTSKEEMTYKTFIIKMMQPMWFDILADKEVLTYVEALPKIEEFMFQKFAPKLFLYHNRALVMENLRQRGFKHVNSLNLLDYKHCLVAIEALARFHAGSVLLHKKEPALVEKKIGWEVCINNPEDILGFIKKMVHTFEKEIDTWPEVKHYVKHFSIVRKKIVSYFQNISNRKFLKVLNHGDFWLNNLMFLYDSSGNIKDVRMVDFKSCRYCSPACDIQYFIASSANLDVRLNKMDSLLDAYWRMLNQSLQRLAIPQRLTKADFLESLNDEYIMYFIGLILTLCTCLNDPQDRYKPEGVKNSFEEMGKEANMRFESLLKSPRYKNFVIPVLDDITKKGAFLSFR